MKKLIISFAVFILTIITVSALDSYDATCQGFGLDDGIAKWVWDGNTWYSDGLSSSTHISGDSQSIKIDNGFFASNAVIYSLDGTEVVTGNIGSHEGNGIYQVMFCANNQNGKDSKETLSTLRVQSEEVIEVPEFSSVFAILAIVGAFAIYIKKRN